MERNLIVALICLLTFPVRGKALKCYVCHSSLQGAACNDPIDTSNINYRKCEDLYRTQRITNVSELQESYQKLFGRVPVDYNYYNDWKNTPTDFECTQYELLYTRSGKREFVRKCQGRNEVLNFCNELRQRSYFEGYTLTKCNVCYRDYCNSGINFKLPFLLNVLTFFVMSLNTLI